MRLGAAVELGFREPEDLSVRKRASHIPRLTTPRPQPKSSLVLLLVRAGVDEVLDLPEHAARFDLAVDRVPIVLEGDGPGSDRHASHAPR